MHSIKYGYNSYSIGFDVRSQFSLSKGELGKDVVIFYTDNSLSLHADNRKKDILVLGEGLTNESKYSYSITKSRKSICLSLHYNPTNSFLYVNSVKTKQRTGQSKVLWNETI